MSRERRQHPRYAAALDFECATSHGTLGITSRDLSVGGAFLYTRTPEPAGTRVVLSVHIPRGPLITVSGEVAHCIPEIGMGVRFVELSAAGQFLLRQYLKILERVQSRRSAPPPSDEAESDGASERAAPTPHPRSSALRRSRCHGEGREEQ